MPGRWFVVTGNVPGFHEGDVVDIETGRRATKLTMDERWTLIRHRHQLRAVSSLPRDRSEEASQSSPPLLRAME